jgi:hypothetical protein
MALAHIVEQGRPDQVESGRGLGLDDGRGLQAMSLVGDRLRPEEGGFIGSEPSLHSGPLGTRQGTGRDDIEQPGGEMNGTFRAAHRFDLQSTQ